MSADGSINQSNKSLASTISSLLNEEEAPPRFVSMKPPNFATVIEVIHDPPSFALSAALEDASQQHPPVSPGTATCIFDRAWRNYVPRSKPLSAEEAEDFLHNNDDLDATV